MTVLEPRNDDAEERRLISRIARFQDVRALERLYELYKSRLIPFMSRFLRSPESIEELYDDVMWVVWEQGGSIRRALESIDLDLRDRVQQGDSPVQEGDAGVAEVGGEVGDAAIARALGPEDTAAETADLIARALDALTPEHRLVVELSYFTGRTYGEIAEIAGIPENTVKTRMFHARRKLQTIVEALV